MRMLVSSRQNVRVKTNGPDRLMTKQKNQKILGLVHSNFADALRLFLEHSRDEFDDLNRPDPVEEGDVFQKLEALCLELVYSVELPVPRRHRY